MIKNGFKMIVNDVFFFYIDVRSLVTTASGLASRGEKRGRVF